MPRKITVTFADGSQHVYDNAPDDVTPQQIVDRATREFSKPVKGVDGGRGAIERAARGVGSMVTGAVDALDQAMQPVREAVGYDPAEQARKTDELARRVREKQQADIARQDGLFDAAGDLFTRGEVGMGAGIERVASGLAVTPAERQRFIDRARASEQIAATPIAGETTWDAATSDLTKLPGFIAEQAITSLPYMATAAIGPFGALSNAASVTGDVAQRRAEADGRTDASGRDVAIAAPFGVASTVLDSLALGSMAGNIGTRGLGRTILVDAATEGLTEGIQSGLEYTGGSVGTERGFSASELASQMAQGAVVGTGVGGMFGGITGGATEAFDAAGRIKFRRADDARSPGPGMREQAVADATNLTPEDLASPLDNADLAAGRAEIASATVGGQVDSALTQAGLPKAGTKVDVSNLPGGARLTGTIEDVFSDETGVGVVVRPEGGGKAMREYLDTLNELGVSITPSDPMAEANAIDAALAAQASAPVEGSSPLAPASAETPLPSPSGRTPSASAGGGVNFNMDSYLARVRQAESGGRDNAKAKGSSATGRYQFTDGTWLATYKQVFGDTGENEAQILAKRSDGAVQDRLMGRLTQDNAEALRKAGLPVNDTTLYLAHFAGIGGARSILKVAPERAIETVLGKGAVEANSFLKGKTAGDVIAWAAGKMGGSVPAMADSTPLVPEGSTQYADLPEAPKQDVRVDAPAPDLPQTNANGWIERDDGGFVRVEEHARGSNILDPTADIGALLYTYKTSKNDSKPLTMVVGKDGSLIPITRTLNTDNSSNGSAWVPPSPTVAQQVKDLLKRRALTNPKSDERAAIDATIKGIVTGKNTAGPQDGGVAPTVEAPQAGGPEATAASNAGSAAGVATNLAEPVSNTEQLPAADAPAARVEDTGTGKSVAVIGASEAEIAAISAAVPKAKAMPRKDGALVYSKKYADKIRAALDGVTETVTPAEDAPKGMRQGEVGMMLSAGESVRTTGGRTTTPFPKISMDTDRKAGNTLRNVDKWLAENALAEALARGDDFNAPMFQRMVDNPRNISQSDKDSAEQYLFGEQPPVLPPLGRPMDAAPARPATKPERPLSERDPRAYREQESKNLPEGYSISETSSGIVLKGPGGGMVGGYLAPSGTSGETLERAVKSAKQMAATAAAAARLSGAMNDAATKTSPDSVTVVAVDATPSKNRLVTDERAAELRDRLKAKLNPGRLNSGIDPEILAIGAELAVYHIEKGARRFAAFAQAIATDLDAPLSSIRQYLRGWYNGARDMMEDMGESVAGMDSADEVGKAMRTFDQWANEPAVTEGENAATGAVDAELPNRVSASDAGTSPGDVQRTAPVGRDGRAPQPEGERGAGDVSPTDRERADATERGAVRSADGTRGDRAGVRNDADVPTVERNAGSARKAAASVKGADWVIEPGSLDEGRSLAQKARDNVEAIALVKQIEREGRAATREEQATIARYIGWGGLKNIFPDPRTGEYGKGFEILGPRLRELLTDDEYATARQSIQYAHYTSESVVRPMWDIARQLGFKGGLVFEPGMGTGNFRGMMPADVAAASSYTGLEYDHLTASIAKLLYPQSGVQQADYTRAPGIKNAVDLVIGNPPFSETAISSDPDYAKHRFLLHDFFFAKSLDALKPGGLLMFITSAGTMNKVSDKARQYLADQADLVGAIRLPGNAFEQNAGTSVTTDIVILRKRLPGEKIGDTAWVGTETVAMPDRDGNTVQGSVNRYFVQNPAMVLGEQGMFDKLVAGPRYAVRAPKGFNIEQAIRDAAARLPGSIVDTAPPALSTGFLSPDVDLGSGERKDGSFYLGPDGRLMQYRGGVGRPVQSPGKGVTGGMSAAAQERVRGLIPVKDALRQVYAADLKADTAAGSVAREKLNAAYDAFVKKFGPINKTDISYRRPSRVELESLRAEAREEARLSGTEWDDGSFDIQPLLDAGAKMTEIARAREEAREKAVAAGRQWNEGTFDPGEIPDKVIEKRPNLDPFMEDDEAYRLAAIEHYNKDTGEAAKGRAFFDNAITLDQAPKINSANDALLFSLNRFGRPDLRAIAQMSGKSETEVIEELGDRLFEVPGKPGVYETGELYLSGNVREKLALARVEAERNPAFQRNVRALEAALPAPLTPTEIAANLGMPWLPTKVVQQFATEKLGLRQANVSYLPKLAQWMATGDTTSAAARADWGTERMDAMKILEAALNRQTPVIRDRIETAQGEKSVVNEVATQAVQDKMAEMKAAFREWVWTDPARSANLVDLYNRDYNSLVAPKFDGTYLTTPGIASGWSWRPHQRAVIARIIQSGNTYMAHEVGAGKTSAMIGSGMEMKRLGLVSKPMYVVPNHMLGQFTKEFYEQYPLARILVADEQRFHTSRRKEFIARMAAEDWDAIIITHSAFGFIPMSDDFTSGMIQQQIDELEDLIAEIGKGQDVRITRRKVEQQKEALSQRLAGLTNRKRDQVFTFEETGVDFLFVDEAHLFRKLDFATKMGNVKGIDPAGSQMSFDLYAKSRYLEARKPGRNLALASGTPITNTMAELFSVSRYLQQGELEKRGLGHFDAWAGAFGDTVTALEQDAAGGYKPVTRFAQFVNVPELSVMVRQVMDVVGATELRQYVSLPNLKGGNRQLITVEMTPAQERYKGELQSRMEAIKRRSGPPKKGDDILLSVIGDGRKAAIDYRLIDASAPKDAGSKLERMIEEVARRHKDFTRSAFHKPLPAGAGFSAKPETYGPATQMIFSDFGINGDFPVHKYIKSALIERGIPASQIALIQDFKTHIAKQRLFNDMNEGKVRVLIGSVAKMGTGVNAQKRLRALHNMDAQWYPANDTQRNGRIIRQGNMNPEIEILDYATNGTYDSTMWGLMAKKARFIEGFMRGDPTMRDMEDLGEASQYEQASAMTTSDPRIMELTEWKQELEKIERRQMAHEREQQGVRMRLASARNDVAEAERLIPLIEQDIAKRQVQEGDEFSATLKGQTFDDRTEYGAALMAAMDALVERSKGKEAREGIGDFGGFPLVAEVYPRGTNGEAALSFYIKRAGQRESRVDMGTDARGLVTRLTNTIKAFDKDLAYATNMKATAEQRIADFEPKLGATFDDGGKAETLRAKVTDLESTLKAESDAAEAAARQSAETNVQQSIPETVLPTVSVLESDWGKLPKPGKARLDILRGRVSRWYDGLVGTTVTASDGREVRFNSAGEKKTLRAGEELLMRARAIPKIIQRGKLVSSEPSNRGGMKAVHRYAAIVRTEAGDARALMVLVRETADGSFQYSLHNVVEKSSDAPVETGREAPKEAIAPALDGGAEDGFNLVALEEVGNPQTSSDLTDISEALRAHLAALRIADRVKLRVVESLSGSAGTYAQGLISIATDTAQGEAFTLDHEAIHALRDMGLFKNEEWAILAARARRDATLMRSIRQRYEAGFQQRGMAGAKLDEAIIEEAVADLFARYQDGRYKTDGTVERVFKMLRQLFEAVRNVFAGRGLRTAEGVMQDVASGEVGARSGQASLDASPSESLPARDNMVALGGSEPTWRGKMADAFDQWRTAIQDRYLPLLKVQRQIEQQTGKSLPTERNPYMGEELMTGRIGARLEELADGHVQPLFDAMHAEKVSVEELESYLYARHAPERNARIAEINPEFTEGEGSGMTDLEAAAIMSRIRKAGKAEAMERLAARVDAIRDMALDYRVETGLISKEDADEWRSTYQFYVPLRGFKETGTDAIADGINRSGGGINVRGRESKQAFGRRSQADSPLAYSILQAEEAIVRGETNLVAQRFVNLAKANPDPEFWSINKSTARRRVNEESGLVETYLTHNLLAEDKDWTVSAKFNGVERRVTMNRQNKDARRLADAMRNLTQHQLDFVTLHLGKVNRFLSAVNTSFNPEFVITNAFRDIQTAAFNLSGEGIKGIVKGTARDYRSALVASTQGAFGKKSGEWGKWYDEFVSEGGRVYFNRVENVEEIKQRIASAAEMSAAKAGEGGTRMQAKRLFIAARDFIENANNGVENAVRLSVYKNARDAGLSPAQAASMAKNITVNFNRRGTAGPALNAAYLFFNASVQGTARILMSLRSAKVRKMMAGVMMAAAGAEMLNAMMSADDDDGESIYDKIPAFDKSRNIVLMMPDGKSYVKIPMPYGYNAFWEAGRSVAEIARRGGQRWKETAAQFVGTVADSFNPIGGSHSLLNFLAPTIADPIVDLTLNKDFTGKPIMPNQPAYGPEDPDNQRYFNGVGTHWKAVTEFLNDATGGDQVQPGAIDISPETLEYLSVVVVGSAGAFLNRAYGLIGKTFDESEDVTANDIPFIRKTFGAKPSWVDKAAFYDRLSAVETAMDRTEKYLDAGDQEKALDYAMDNRSALLLEGAAKQARKDMRDVRKARNELETAKERGTIDDATYREKKMIVRRAEDLVLTEFNAQWVATMKANGDAGGGN